MTAVVVDTDVASAILKGRLPDRLDRALSGRRLAITFVTDAGMVSLPETCWLFVGHTTTGETTSVTLVLKANPAELLTAAR